MAGVGALEDANEKFRRTGKERRRKKKEERRRKLIITAQSIHAFSCYFDPE